MPEGYEREPLDLSPPGLEATRRLLAAAFPAAHHLDAAFLSWSYRDNPDGLAVGFNALHRDEVVAHIVMQPFRAHFDDRLERGLLAYNTATHPAHQGRGLFTAIGERTLAAAGDAGFDFAMAITNTNSTPGFVRKLGYQLVGSLDAKLGLGPLPRGGARTDARYARHWDGETLRWRLARPGNPYRVRRRGARARILGPTGNAGIWAEIGEVAAADLGAGVAELRALNPLRLWIGLDPARRWTGRAYLDVPVRLRPSPLNFVFLDLRGAGRRLAVDEIFFEILDFDAY